MFKLVLADLQYGLCREFEQKFEGVEKVSVHHGQFEDVDFDCVVSAANSFGLMDGGVDGAITMMFGEQLMKRVQTRIINEFGGEQPVGTSFVIRATEHSISTNGPHVKGKDKYVAHTPTMTIPKDIRNTNNVYMAMKAMLLAVKRHNKLINRACAEAGEVGVQIYNQRIIETVVCTGLGTFCGNVPFEKAAREMRLAYDHVTNPPTQLDWDFAVKRNNEIFLTKIN